MIQAQRHSRFRLFAAFFCLALLILPILPLPAADPTPTPPPQRVRILTGDPGKKSSTAEIHLFGNVPDDMRQILEEQWAISAPTPTPPPAPPAPSPSPAAVFSTSTLTLLAAMDGATTSTLAAADPASAREAARLYQDAQALFSQNRLPEGRRLLSQILTHWPQSYWAGQSRIALARQDLQEGRYAGAIAYLSHQTVFFTPPARQSQAWITAAEAYIGLEDYENARAAARRVSRPGATGAQREAGEGLLDRLRALGAPAPELQFEALAQDASSRLEFQTLGLSPRSGPDGRPALALPRGGVHLLLFYRIQCPYCRRAYPRQVRFTDEIIAQGGAVCWIASDPGRHEPLTLEAVREDLAQYPRPGFVALDRDLGKTFRDCAGRATPWAVLVDRAGRVRYTNTWNERNLRDKLTQLLGE